MCRALDRPEWLEDERFNTAQGRIVNVKDRLTMTAEVLATRTSQEWLERLDHEAVPCAPVLQRHEVLDHEQIRINEMIEEFDHPIAGRLRQPRPAARFDKTPARMMRHAPTLGQHNDELLAELGIDARVLRDAGVIPDENRA